MNPKKINIIFWMSLVFLFCVFVIFWERNTLQKDRAELRKKIQVIEGALWNLDPEGPVEYLKLSARLGKYERITVFAVGDTVFLDVPGPEVGLLDRILINIGLIPKIRLEADILHDGLIVGRVEALHLHNTIYLYMYLLVIMGLVLLVVNLFTKTLHAKQTLEIRVEERTAELRLKIIERKMAEEEKATLEVQLRQAQKMEAIGTLAGGIAHDFNNILAAIIGYAELAKDDIPADSPSSAMIDEVLKAGNRAKELVKHILSFSRKTGQERIPIQIHHIVNEALKLLRATIPTTIEIRRHIDSHCGNILADPVQMHQVLMNLCTNAAHSMEEKGEGVLEIRLEGDRLTADDLATEPTLTPGPYVRLSVSDTGTGIDKNHIDRIFDPYFTTKDVGKGSGMGLAVVHGIVKNHEGMLIVKSKVGEGTTFTVYFPRVEDEVRLESEDTGPPCGGTERILMVDDEEAMVDMTRRNLENLGYSVVTKTSSVAAYELFRSRPEAFDLVITDQTMPKLAGDQLSMKLMNIRPDIPIILCTGFSSKIDKERAEAVGIRAFAMKPVALKEFSKTIRQVLDGDRIHTLNKK